MVLIKTHRDTLLALASQFLGLLNVILCRFFPMFYLDKQGDKLTLPTDIEIQITTTTSVGSSDGDGFNYRWCENFRNFAFFT